MLDQLTAAAFLPQEGSEFTVDIGDGGPLVLRLMEVVRFPLQPNAPRTEPFSLLFVGPADPVLPQRIHALDHPVMGPLEIFLVALGPVGRDDARMRYEAAFN